MSSPVEQIKEKLDIAAVVSSYIKIEKVGGNYRARCPFHNEKTPSFFVSPSRETWHCFGCNKGGDIFSFVEEIEGVDFSGALKILAEKAGVILERGKSEEHTEKGRLFALLSDATLFFRKELRKNHRVIEYLKKRGLTGATIDEFGIGFAPDEWHALEGYLRSRGYRDDEMEKSGMSIRAENGRIHDRFRSRIMFPLSDNSGRIVAFSGRVFESDDSAKYVNSPETPLYHKAKILYGFDKAKNAIREAGICIIVEGQMDLLMAHQAGTKNTVAVSGTALTLHHLENIKRFTGKIILAFDGDEAGIKATKRTALFALPAGFDVYSLELPSGGVDPADFILESREKWKKALSRPVHVAEFFLDIAEKKGLSGRDLRLEAEKNVIPILAHIQSRIDREHFIGLVSARIGVSAEAVREETEKAVLTGKEDEFSYHKPDVYVSTPSKERPAAKSRRERLERTINGIILWQQSVEKPLVPPLELMERYKKITKPVFFSDEEKNVLMFEAENFYGGGDSLLKSVNDLFLDFEKEVIRELLIHAQNDLARAEALHDREKEVQLERHLGELMIRQNKLAKTLLG